MTREEKENLLREAVDIVIKLDNHLMTSRDNAEFSQWVEDLIENYCEVEPQASEEQGMITPEEKISYAAICEQMPIPHLYFGTYKEAEDYAKSEQPAYRPYYIVERVEHFEICGVIGDKAESEE